MLIFKIKVWSQEWLLYKKNPYKSPWKNVKDNIVYNDYWESGSTDPELEASVLLCFCVSKDVSVGSGAFSSDLERTFGKPWLNIDQWHMLNWLEPRDVGGGLKQLTLRHRREVPAMRIKVLETEKAYRDFKRESRNQ